MRGRKKEWTDGITLLSHIAVLFRRESDRENSGCVLPAAAARFSSQSSFISILYWGVLHYKTAEHKESQKCSQEDAVKFIAVRAHFPFSAPAYKAIFVKLFFLFLFSFSINGQWTGVLSFMNVLTSLSVMVMQEGGELRICYTKQSLFNRHTNIIQTWRRRKHRRRM